MNQACTPRRRHPVVWLIGAAALLSGCLNTFRTGPVPGTTNWGSTAAKKTTTFGFVTPTTNPSRRMRRTGAAGTSAVRLAGNARFEGPGNGALPCTDPARQHYPAVATFSHQVTVL